MLGGLVSVLESGLGRVSDWGSLADQASGAKNSASALFALGGRSGLARLAESGE